MPRKKKHCQKAGGGTSTASKARRVSTQEVSTQDVHAANAHATSMAATVAELREAFAEFDNDNDVQDEDDDDEELQLPPKRLSIRFRVG